MLALLLAAVLLPSPSPDVAVAAGVACSVQVAPDEAVSRPAAPLSYAQRELQSRDLEEFTGGGAGLAVFIIVVVAVLVLIAIILPW